jgi:hypothetical protein
MHGQSYLNLSRISLNYRERRLLVHYNGEKNCRMSVRLVILIGRKNIDKVRVRKWKTEHSEKKATRKGKGRKNPDHNL